MSFGQRELTTAHAEWVRNCYFRVASVNVGFSNKLTL